jgi:enamine deaminase RidA (YjgF/YER057c/UK114 family)
MAKNTRRTFMAAAAPALLAAPLAARQAASAQPAQPAQPAQHAQAARTAQATPPAAQATQPAQPARKRTYRKLTPTSKTVKGEPLYSPEVSFGNLVFVSGRGGGTDAAPDITAQTKTVLDQIEESLKLAGSSMDKVLKVNVYLTDMKNFEGMNKAYIGRFGSEPPVRTTVSITAVPDYSLVEIDCIAHL